MIVRPSQVDALRAPAEASYLKSATDHLARVAPALSASAGRHGLEQAARLALDAARRHDLVAGPALQIYLELIAWLGSGFDTDPQYRWLRPYLDPREDIASIERARFLHFHAGAYRRRACGAGQEFARAALERGMEFLARWSGAALGEAEPLKLLGWLHPQRLEFVDADAATALLASARETAAAAGFPPAAGANVLLVLLLLFGSKVAADPLYPWVGETLRGSGPAAERWARLLAAASRHIPAIASGLT